MTEPYINIKVNVLVPFVTTYVKIGLHNFVPNLGTNFF